MINSGNYFTTFITDFERNSLVYDYWWCGTKERVYLTAGVQHSGPLLGTTSPAKRATPSYEPGNASATVKLVLGSRRKGQKRAREYNESSAVESVNPFLEEDM